VKNALTREAVPAALSPSASRIGRRGAEPRLISAAGVGVIAGVHFQA
jgi:hypothetical protein